MSGKLKNFQRNVCSRCLNKNKRKVKDSLISYLKENEVFLSDYETFVYELLSRNPNEAVTVDGHVKIVINEYKNNRGIFNKQYLEEKRIVREYYYNRDPLNKRNKRYSNRSNKSSQTKIKTKNISSTSKSIEKTIIGYEKAVKDIEEFNKNSKFLLSDEVISEFEIEKAIIKYNEIKDFINSKEGLISALNRKNYSEYSRFNKFPNVNKIIKFQKLFIKYQDKINSLLNLQPTNYFSKRVRKELKKEYGEVYYNFKGFKKLYTFDYDFIKEMESTVNEFLSFYEDILNYKDLNSNNRITRLNEKYINNEIKNNASLFKSLNNSQKRAIVIDEDNLQIIAGAGTGKTTTLVNKVKYLVESKGINPSKIIALSFSSASAKELRESINENLKTKEKVEVSTFHKLGKNILEKKWKYFWWKP